VKDHVENETQITTDFYSLMFKNYCRNTVKYGRKLIDFQDGSLICIAPNQTITIDTDVVVSDKMVGWGVFFHPDLIRNTSLGNKIKEYNYFSYEVSEALHLSEKEEQKLQECVLKIESELDENIDVHSQSIIVSAIELLLNYCTRFYSRQFITRKSTNKSVVSNIEQILTTYFSSNNIKDKGLPTVKYLADKVNLSSSYLSDLLKKETGKNAQDLIHFHLIEEAKNNLLNTSKTVSEIAYSLGFEYPQYFNKLFKLKTGKTPVEYRSLN
jgi:AraC-like DNA-binding protein